MTDGPRYGQPDREYGMRLASTPAEEDGPVWMLNLMKYREVADYADGSESTISGREADGLYAPLGPLAAVGAQVVFMADVEQQLLGDAPQWDRVAIVKYPTRRAFIEMQSLPEFREKHVHKEAGMQETIVMGCQPIDLPARQGVEQPDWADVPHPPTEEDGSIVILHVLRFNEGGADGPMAQYSATAGDVALPHGVRVTGWFSVEGTIIGDGRSWDQARFNAFPSKAAFMAVVADPTRQEAESERRAAIADSYSLLLRPAIDLLAMSVEEAKTG